MKKLVLLMILLAVGSANAGRVITDSSFTGGVSSFKTYGLAVVDPEYDWEDEFPGSALDAKWTEYPEGASSTASVADGFLELFVDGPTDGVTAKMRVMQFAQSVTLPLIVDAKVHCPEIESGVSSAAFWMYLYYPGGILDGQKNGVGLLWGPGFDGYAQARAYDASGTSLKYDPVSNVYGNSVIMRVSIDVDGVASVAIRSTESEEFIALPAAAGTPSFAGKTSVDIMLFGTSLSTESSRTWKVDYIRAVGE